MPRPRLRDLGITIGRLPPGPHNAITDVPGVRVGHTTLISDAPTVARTGVTVIVPRDGAISTDNAFAGMFSFNGFGEMTGAHWLHEAGLLASPIAITNSFSVGTVSDALYALGDELTMMPVVAETYDGWLNDIRAFHVRHEHVAAALSAASAGPVAEGNVGGGTGMLCHGFKGGIGTASRRVASAGGQWTLGALVQANYGERGLLRVDGVPVGRLITPAEVPTPRPQPATGGSIIVVLATDAPLLALDCQRLARRATVGLARVGGTGHDSSGDLFLAFATGNHVPATGAAPFPLQALPHDQLNPFFEAVAEAVEEAILNALCAAETMTGLVGHTAHALPLDRLAAIMAARSRHVDDV